WNHSSADVLLAGVRVAEKVVADRAGRRPGQPGHLVGGRVQLVEVLRNLVKTMSALHPDLKGRVAVVTGASRGIGKALALRLAREGADVTIAAKSETSSEKLPGSIYDAADEVRSLGRKALAVPTDVRNDDAVRGMIAKTIAEFGRIDILINNAGALWWQKVIDTPPKRFDLMMGVNVRAAYLTSHYALPHMVKQRWGHIINMCPPISTEPNPGHVCYMITKMGMARLAIGIAAEHRADKIAANALRPRTHIETQASINWGMATRRGRSCLRSLRAIRGNRRLTKRC